MCEQNRIDTIRVPVVVIDTTIWNPIPISVRPLKELPEVKRRTWAGRVLQKAKEIIIPPKPDTISTDTLRGIVGGVVSGSVDSLGVLVDSGFGYVSTPCDSIRVYQDSLVTDSSKITATAEVQGTLKKWSFAYSYQPKIIVHYKTVTKYVQPQLTVTPKIGIIVTPQNTYPAAGAQVGYNGFTGEAIFGEKGHRFYAIGRTFAVFQ